MSHEALGRHAEAEQARGRDDPSVAVVIDSLALLYNQSGRRAQARASLRDAQEMLARLAGREAEVDATDPARVLWDLHEPAPAPAHADAAARLLADEPSASRARLGLEDRRRVVHKGRRPGPERARRVSLAAVVRPTSSGRHEFWYEGEVFGVRFRGPITRPGVEVLRQALEAVADEHPRTYMLMDMQECTGIDPEARKYMAVWSREPDRGLVGIAIYGTGFMMRALVTFALSAIRLLGQLKTEVFFCKDEAEARRWAEERRAGAGGPPPAQPPT